MSLSENTYRMLSEMTAAHVDFIVVGGSAAILGGAFVVTEDLDIVHRRTPENVARLLPWLNAHGAYHRYDLANRRLPPKEDGLLGHGHLNLQLDIGKLDVLCELGDGEGYEQLLPDTYEIQIDDRPLRVLALSRLIVVKAKAGRPKDRAVLPLLLAALDEQRRGKS